MSIGSPPSRIRVGTLTTSSELTDFGGQKTKKRPPSESEGGANFTPPRPPGRGGKGGRGAVSGARARGKGEGEPSHRPDPPP